MAMQHQCQPHSTQHHNQKLRLLFPSGALQPFHCYVKLKGAPSSTQQLEGQHNRDPGARQLACPHSLQGLNSPSPAGHAKNTQKILKRPLLWRLTQASDAITYTMSFFQKSIIPKCIVFKKPYRVGYSVAGTCGWDGLGWSVWAPPGAKSPLRVKN